MKSIFKFSIVALIFFSCKREEVDYLGPAYISAPDGFVVTSFTASPTSVDFTAGSVTLNATFTNNVSWILTIKGQQSGAVREYRGTGSSVNEVWTGTHTGVTFFRTGETATATLSFYGTTYTSSVDIVIIKARNFALYGQFPLVGDFEDPSLVEPQPQNSNPYSPYYASFNFPTPIPNVVQKCGTAEVDYNGNVVPSVEGTHYYFIRGLGDQQVFVSGIQYYGTLNPKMPNDPANVWVNLYVYGTGDANSGIDIEYQESDLGGYPGYQGTEDDAFVAHIEKLDHKGWKLFSFRYSDLPASLNANFGGSGNKIHEPHRIVSFDVILLKKTNPNKPVEVYFDYPIITYGGPFDPSK